jgi:uncharacterized protein with FMN-binding domain
MKRAIAALFGTVAGLVMLLGFKTHTTVGPIPAAVAATGDTNGGGTAAGTGTPATTSGTSSAKNRSSPGGNSGTYLGDTVNTQWGPVQVQITVTNGKVTSASAVQYPNGNSRDQQINAYAVPRLNREAVSAGSARIDMVSGATYTSTGYLQSLQSALNRAGL